jgi:hypothetical protein
MLSPPEKGIGFLAAHLNRERAVAALVGGRLVGLAGYRHAGTALVGGSPKAERTPYLKRLMSFAAVTTMHHPATPPEPG